MANERSVLNIFVCHIQTQQHYPFTLSMLSHAYASIYIYVHVCMADFLINNITRERQILIIQINKKYFM